MLTPKNIRIKMRVFDGMSLKMVKRFQIESIMAIKVKK